VRGHFPVLLRWLRLSFGPCLLGVAVLAGDGGWWPPAGRLGLFMLLGVVNAGMFAAASMAWGFALPRAGGVDDVLRPCGDRDRVAGVVGGALGHGRQVVLPVVFGAVPWVVAGVHGDFGSGAVVPVVVLVVNVSWSLAWLGNVSFWLLVPPLVALRMRSCEGLALRWNDPARTPGIRTLCEGFPAAADG